MSESLVRRVKRVVSGGVQSLVDAMEAANAEGMLREVLRETEQIIDDVRDEHAKATATRYQTTRQIERTKAKHLELGERARLAVGQRRDDLAEAALSRQLDLEAHVPLLEGTLAEATAKQRELESYIAALTGRKREMEEQLAAFVAARPTRLAVSEAGLSDGIQGHAYINATERRLEKTSTAFGRIMQSAAGMSVPPMPAPETSVKLLELEHMSRSGEIASRLANIKAASVSAG